MLSRKHQKHLYGYVMEMFIYVWKQVLHEVICNNEECCDYLMKTANMSCHFVRDHEGLNIVVKPPNLFIVCDNH